MTHVYFVSYDVPNGFGNVDVSSDGALTTIEQIRALEAGLCEQFGFERVTVRHFALLRVENSVSSLPS